jgi:hypothetical protein
VEISRSYRSVPYMNGSPNMYGTDPIYVWAHPFTFSCFFGMWCAGGWLLALYIVSTFILSLLSALSGDTSSTPYEKGGLLYSPIHGWVIPIHKQAVPIYKQAFTYPWDGPIHEWALPIYKQAVMNVVTHTWTGINLSMDKNIRCCNSPVREQAIPIYEWVGPIYGLD